jgi:hypothetical protein
MWRRPDADRVTPMANSARTVTRETTLWTEFVVAGERVYIRTRRAEPLAAPLGEPAREKSSEPLDIDVRTVVPEAEP